MTHTAHEHDLIEFCRVNGYIVTLRKPHSRHIVFVEELLEGQACLGVGTPNFVEERYTYATPAGAVFALLSWAMRDYRGEPKGWHRHQPSGRRRIGGDPATEHIAR